MATKNKLDENYKGKLFCVSTTRYIDGGAPTFTVFPKLYVSLSSAMEQVANIVNGTLAFEKKKKKKRLKLRNRTDALLGGYSLPTGDGRLVINITACDKPWSVQYMDCDNMEHTVELFPDQESATIAVATEAKAYINAMRYDKPDHIYAYRGGECEIEAKGIKKSEAYIMVETIGGNHIEWRAKQI